MGKLIGDGYNLTEIEKQMGVFPEGYNTLSIALSWAKDKEIDLPLAKNIEEVISGKSSIFFEVFSPTSIEIFSSNTVFDSIY